MTVRSAFLLAFLFSSVAEHFARAQPLGDSAQPNPVNVKLIEWGWDEPNTQFLKEHAAEMQRFPFDGVVFHLTTTGNFTWEVWGTRQFERNEFDADLKNLQETEFGRLTDNFIRVNVTPGTSSWFDEETWKTIVRNCGHVAAVAKAGKCRGILLDTEQYQGQLFKYSEESEHSLEETRQRVRVCGREWIEEVNREFPEITLFLSFAYRTSLPKPGQTPSEARYALLPDFLDGMLEGCTPQTRFVDGFEQAYAYKQTEQFQQGRQTIRHDALDWTAFPEKYEKQFFASFGIWMDCNLFDHGWHPDDFSRNYFSPAAFETSVRAARKESDLYVWIYTEQPRWWTDEKLPETYVEALKKARRP